MEQTFRGVIVISVAFSPSQLPRNFVQMQSIVIGILLNPLTSPYFGGLWEASVKFYKQHLKWVIWIPTLTFEEMSTLVSRIETILNSRPITPQSSDLNDFRSLTPGNIVVGAPIVLIPEPDLTTIPSNYLYHWQFLSSLHQSFWTKWASEYL